MFDLNDTVESDPAIDGWWASRDPALSSIARRWFAEMQGCGEDVREVLHDDAPTACVGRYAFAYVNAFTSHVNVGFFYGAFLADPGGLLEGRGKRMRHVKLRPGVEVDPDALGRLIRAAYDDLRRRMEDPGGHGRP